LLAVLFVLGLLALADELNAQELTYREWADVFDAGEVPPHLWTQSSEQLTAVYTAHCNPCWYHGNQKYIIGWVQHDLYFVEGTKYVMWGRVLWPHNSPYKAVIIGNGVDNHGLEIWLSSGVGE